MKKRWMLVTDNYSGIAKKAADILYAEIAGLVNYVLPAKGLNNLTETDKKEYNLILIGKTGQNDIFSQLEAHGDLTVPVVAEGYGIYVGKSPLYDNRIIAIAGQDAHGVLYGCMDFCNKYLGNIIHRKGDIWDESFFDALFERELNPFKTTAFPAVKTRAVWTWGHVIYDYRSFFKNMARLRLNEVVIWNDRLPLNADEVVDFAHSLGIKLIWGFAWGWGVDCADILHNLNEDSLNLLKKSIIKTYTEEYKGTDCDGIYFQSFTELHTDVIDSNCIAETVVNLVNEISSELFKISPELHIQFGLHATSVKNNLDYIRKVDNRIHIVWEDCGSFPYNYYADDVSDFDDTLKLTQELVHLRGSDERFGAVLKGMPKLDWTRFEHFTQSYILGERTNTFIHNRLHTKSTLWKKLQSDWLRNAEYARKIIQATADGSEEVIIQALIEDSLFENKIMFPAALYAEMLWTPNRPVNEMIADVAGYPCIRFANEN